MVNPGHASTGCHACRKRKVKCDEGRPGCRNCARLKKECPGYREPCDLLFRHKPIAAPKVSNQRSQDLQSIQIPKRKPAQTKSDLPKLVGTSQRYQSSDDSLQGEREEYHSRMHINQRTETKPSEIIQTPTNQVYQRYEPQPALSTDLGEYAICYSLSQLDFQARKNYDIYTYDFLPDLVQSAGPESAVYQALRATAVANFANRSSPVDLKWVVRQEYIKALSSVNSALQDPAQNLKDTTLVAVWLLGSRELLVEVAGDYSVSSICKMSPSERQAHVDGTLTLLRLRGEDQFRTPIGRRMFATFLSSMHWRPLFQSQEPREEYLALEAQLNKAVGVVPDASIKVRSFFHNVSKLRARIHNFVSQCGRQNIESFTIVGNYLMVAERLENKVRGWCTVPAWQPQPMSTDKVRRAIPDLEIAYALYSFQDWHGFFHWNRFLLTRIALHEAMLNTLRQVSTPTVALGTERYVNVHDQFLYHQDILRATIDSFVGVIAYAFGDLQCIRAFDSLDVVAVETGYLNQRNFSERETNSINVLATLEIFQPLAYLERVEYLSSGQHKLVADALLRLRKAFMTR